MKITIIKSDFLNALKLADKVATEKGAVTALGCVLISAQAGNEVVIQTTDFEVESIQHLSNVDVDQTGQTMVNIGKLIKLLSLIEEKVLSMETHILSEMIKTDLGDGKFDMGEKLTPVLKITADGGEYMLLDEDFETFPQSKECGDIVNNLQLDLKEFKKVLKLTYVSSNNTLRPAMTGIYLDFKNNYVVSTDAHSLTVYEYFFGVDVEESGSGVILPLQIVDLILDFSGDDLMLEFDANRNIRAIGDGITIVGSLIDAKYPEWLAVVPKDRPMKLTLNKKELEMAIRKVSLFANSSTHQVRFETNGDVDTCKIFAQDYDYDIQAEVLIKSNFVGGDGKPHIFGMNSNFILKALKHLEGDTVTIEQYNVSGASIWTGSDTEYYVLMMPVILSK